MRFFTFTIVASLTVVSFYSDSPAAFLSEQDVTNGPYYGQRGTFFADVDRDGAADAIVVNDDTVIVLRAIVSQCFTASAKTDCPLIGYGANENWTNGPYYGSRGTFFADVDGDRRADAIVVNKNTVTVRRSTGSKFGPNENWTHGPYYGSEGQSVYFVDVDKDKRADAIVVNKDKVIVRRSTGSKFGPNENWTHGPYYGTRGTFFADVTGDERADAIVVNENGITVRRSTGSKFGPNEVWTRGPYYGSEGQSVYFADVDGDKRADAIVINENTVTVRRSTGSAFGLREDWTFGFFLGQRETFFVDVTRNRFADAVAVNDDTVLIRRSDPGRRRAVPNYKAQDFLTRYINQFSIDPEEYYKAIGAISNDGTRDTLKRFQDRNGFSSDNPSDHVRAVYFNNGDLKLGRQMHCKESNEGIACYVSNFGPEPFGPEPFPPKRFPDRARALQDAITHLEKIESRQEPEDKPFATVAMEKPLPDGDVTFYVYDKEGGLQNAAALDSGGLKNVPGICMACHGGSGMGNEVKGASFLPFDVFSFAYSQQASFTLQDQQEAFRQLNAIVKNTKPNSTNPHSPIEQFIDGTYPGGVGNQGSIAEDFVPSGWSSEPSLYKTIVKPYCRTCHLAFGETRDWTNAKQFLNLAPSVVTDICGGAMPHAEVPLLNFWLENFPSPAQLLNDRFKNLDAVRPILPCLLK